jgi:hypothetical protein
VYSRIYIGFIFLLGFFSLSKISAQTCLPGMDHCFQKHGSFVTMNEPIFSEYSFELSSDLEKTPFKKKRRKRGRGAELTLLFTPEESSLKLYGISLSIPLPVQHLSYFNPFFALKKRGPPMI